MQKRVQKTEVCMAHRRQFYLYKRHKKGGDYWYVCFLDKETGKAGNAKSIDCLKERLGIMDFESVKRKEDAAVIATKALEKGLLSSDANSILFASWCRDFWDWDKSEYIALRNKLSPNSIGREYAYNMKKNFEKNVEPLIPKDLKLEKVSVSLLDSIVKTLYRSGKSNGTVEIIITTFSSPLKEAVRLGKIASNPADRILKTQRNEKVRGVLSREEVAALRSALEEHRSGFLPSVYYGILLGLCTGMRISEIRALRTEDIVPSSVAGYSKVLIRHSVAYLSGLKSTKCGYERAALIKTSFADELLSHASAGGILFPSPQNGKEYISAPTLRNGFYVLLSLIGIDEKEREERNISFHSLRHTFSTLGRDADIPQSDRMLVLGHKSERVNDRYTHSTDDSLLRVASFSDSLFSPGAERSAE